MISRLVSQNASMTPVAVQVLPDPVECSILIRFSKLRSSVLNTLFYIELPNPSFHIMFIFEFIRIDTIEIIIILISQCISAFCMSFFDCQSNLMAILLHFKVEKDINSLVQQRFAKVKNNWICYGVYLLISRPLQ